MLSLHMNVTRERDMCKIHVHGNFTSVTFVRYLVAPFFYVTCLRYMFSIHV